MATSSEDRANVYERVTDQIIQAIEAGTDSWVMPWHAGDKAFRFPVNVATGKRYRGVNVISLWAAADVHGYPEALWGTFKQWADLGHFVRKGEKVRILAKADTVGGNKRTLLALQSGHSWRK